MLRWCFFAYGLVGHLLFLVTYAVLAGFVGNLGLPKSIDSPSEGGWEAGGINLGLITLFGLQHSIMARPWFKQVWTRWIPQPIERSTYVYCSLLVTWLLMWQWRGMDAVVWNVTHPIGRGLLWVLFAAGWVLVPLVSLMINHFDLFGTRQVWLHLQGRSYQALAFRTPLLYAHIRHPLYIGWMLAFWATPTMTVGHFLFASAFTLYMLVAVVFEERDLVHHFGEVYRNYQRNVPKFLPRLHKDSGAEVPNPLVSPASAGLVSEQSLRT